MSPERQTTAREDDLATTDAYALAQLERSLGRPARLISNREAVRWRALNLVEAARGLVENVYRKDRR